MDRLKVVVVRVPRAGGAARSSSKISAPAITVVGHGRDASMALSEFAQSYRAGYCAITHARHVTWMAGPGPQRHPGDGLGMRSP